MQAILLFLAVSAIIGARGLNPEHRIPTKLLLLMSLLLAMALFSRRVV